MFREYQISVNSTVRAISKINDLKKVKKRR